MVFKMKYISYKYDMMFCDGCASWIWLIMGKWAYVEWD